MRNQREEAERIYKQIILYNSLITNSEDRYKKRTDAGNLLNLIKHYERLPAEARGNYDARTLDKIKSDTMRFSGIE